MIGAVWKLIIFISMVKRLINTSRNERVIPQVYDTCLQMFLFFGLRRKDCLTRSTLSSDTRGRPALFPLQSHPVVWNCWYLRLMLLGDGGSPLNCRRNARWRETTDSCFTNCSTQNVNTCCFVPCGRLTFVCVLKAVMADWNCSNHFDTPGCYISKLAAVCNMKICPSYLSDLCYCWHHIDTWYSSALLLVPYSPQHILCTLLLWSKHVHFGSAWHNTRA
jgi:hypothetical protein